MKATSVLDITGECNRVLAHAQNHLGINMHGLSITEGEGDIALFRHADDPISLRPLTAKERIGA